MPEDWKTFEPTVSTESWKRIKFYIEEAQEYTELSDYPSVSSWHEMASVLSMYENSLATDVRYKPLVDDYKTFLEAIDV